MSLWPWSAQSPPRVGATCHAQVSTSSSSGETEAQHSPRDPRDPSSWKRGIPGWAGSFQTLCTVCPASSSPSRARALPEEQPKVISETRRGLFKAAAAGRALAGLGRGRSSTMGCSSRVETVLPAAPQGRGAKSRHSADGRMWNRAESARPRLLFLRAALQQRLPHTPPVPWGAGGVSAISRGDAGGSLGHWLPKAAGKPWQGWVLWCREISLHSSSSGAITPDIWAYLHVGGWKQ